MAEESLLPEELIAEILSWLPVKSLLRFRCVSKRFYELIKSPNFINTHLNRSPDCILITRIDLDWEASSIRLLSYHSYESLDPICRPLEIFEPSDGNERDRCEPCNGIVCLVHFKDIYLYNPATRERVKLPHHPFPCFEDWFVDTAALGFGFDPITNGYKLVEIVRLRDRLEDPGPIPWPFADEDFYDVVVFKAQIYDLHTNRWREIDQELGLTSVGYRSCFGVLFDGVIHWIVSRDDSTGVGSDSQCILSFDFSTEVFGDMDLPDIDDSPRKEKRLMVLRESLALFVYADYPTNGAEHCIDIWVMQEYGVSESWTKHISLGPLIGELRPLLLWRDESILIEVAEEDCEMEQWLVSCPLNRLEMNDSNVLANATIRSLNVMVYRESLLSIRELMAC